MFKYRASLFLILLSACLVFSSNLTLGSTVENQKNQTDWVFYSGFEEGNLDIWDDYDGNPPTTNTLIADPGPFDSANNHVARLRVPPGRGGADLVKVLPASYDLLYTRWYVKWEPGYDFNAYNHGSGLFGGDRSHMGPSGFRPDGTDFLISTVEPRIDSHRMNAYTYYRGMYQDCSDPEGSCWGDLFPCMADEGKGYCTKPHHRETILPPVMVADRWYCIELMIDTGTPTNDPANADGILNFWIDGVDYGPWDDLWFRTSEDLKLTILWLNIFHHAEHSVAGLLFDEVVVSTSRIGCSEESSVPHQASTFLYPAYPNPFNPSTTIAFETTGQTAVLLRVYDMSGRLIKTLVEETFATAERREVVWHGRDNSGRPVASGTYYYRLESGDFSKTMQLVLLK